MKIISIQGGQSVKIGPDIEIWIMQNKGGSVALAFNTPPDVKVERGHMNRAREPLPAKPVWDEVRQCWMMPTAEAR